MDMLSLVPDKKDTTSMGNASCLETKLQESRNYSFFRRPKDTTETWMRPWLGQDLLRSDTMGGFVLG